MVDILTRDVVPNSWQNTAKPYQWYQLLKEVWPIFIWGILFLCFFSDMETCPVWVKFPADHKMLWNSAWFQDFLANKEQKSGQAACTPYKPGFWYCVHVVICVLAILHVFSHYIVCFFPLATWNINIKDRSNSPQKLQQQSRPVDCSTKQVVSSSYGSVLPLSFFVSNTDL